jgi:hypothetical protein
MSKLDPPWRKEAIPAPGFKVVSDNGVDLAWIYAEPDVSRRAQSLSPKLSPTQADWLAGLIAGLPNMVRLDDDVIAALERLMAERAELKTPGAAASYLLRDALIGMGLLPLSSL